MPRQQRLFGSEEYPWNFELGHSIPPRVVSVKPGDEPCRAHAIVFTVWNGPNSRTLLDGGLRQKRDKRRQPQQHVRRFERVPRCRRSGQEYRGLPRMPNQCLGAVRDQRCTVARRGPDVDGARSVRGQGPARQQAELPHHKQSTGPPGDVGAGREVRQIHLPATRPTKADRPLWPCPSWISASYSRNSMIDKAAKAASSRSCVYRCDRIGGPPVRYSSCFGV